MSKYVPGFGISLPLQDGSKIEVLTETMSAVTVNFFAKDGVLPEYFKVLNAHDARDLATLLGMVADKSGPGVRVQGE